MSELENYKEELVLLKKDFYFLAIKEKVERVGQLSDKNDFSLEYQTLVEQIEQWNCRCGRLLQVYSKLVKDNKRLESPEKYIMDKRPLNN